MKTTACVQHALQPRRDFGERRRAVVIELEVHGDRAHASSARRLDVVHVIQRDVRSQAFVLVIALADVLYAALLIGRGRWFVHILSAGMARIVDRAHRILRTNVVSGSRP